MNSLDEFLVPYIISQVVSIIILMAAWKKKQNGQGCYLLCFFSGLLVPTCISV